MTTKRTVPCPGCGLIIVLDDAACTARHESPMCETFAEGMKRHGLEATHDPWVEAVRSDGSVVEKGKA